MTAATPSVRGSFVIQNRLGLHARAAALFVQTVTALDAEVFVTKDGETVNGKSIMGLMMLAAGPGSVILLEAEGPEGPEAIEALVATDLPAARAAVRRAVPALEERQRADGSFGATAQQERALIGLRALRWAGAA